MKTLTFTVEDALLSPISFAMLSGAGVVKGNEDEKVHVHTTTNVYVDSEGNADLSDVLGVNDKICSTAPFFVMGIEADGSLTGDVYDAKVNADGQSVKVQGVESKTVMIDYYILKNSAKVTELQIDAGNFAGYYYVEADTLFRAQIDGQDYPANITIPNVKIQSNWTFTMAATGDPSTFSFTMDAMPGYTYFDQTKKVLCVIQVVEDTNTKNVEYKTVMGHQDDEDYTEYDDSNTDEIGADVTIYTYTKATTYTAGTTYYTRGYGNVYTEATVEDENAFNAGVFYTRD